MIRNEEGDHRLDDRLFSFVGYFGVTTFPLFVDRLLVFHQGQIIEDGSQEELLKMNGHFARLWHMQRGGFLPEQKTED